MSNSKSTSPASDKEVIQIDPETNWLIQLHFSCRDDNFFGKVELSYEEGRVVHRKISVNQKPPKFNAPTA